MHLKYLRLTKVLTKLLSNNMKTQDLKAFVDNNPNLVSKKALGNGLFLLKYKKSVFFKNLWNQYLEECRGTIVDEDFNLVVYPFTKIYNYGIEDGAPEFESGTLVKVHRKVNGFMVAVTKYKGELLVSTTGSIDSIFVDYAKDVMTRHNTISDWEKSIDEGYTYLFECVHEKDPHIIPEVVGMYYLGRRKLCLGSPIDVTFTKGLLLDISIPYSFESTIDEAMEYVRTANHEGYVIYANGLATKIKSPYYLVQKWLARNPDISKILDLKNDIKMRIDEEYYLLVDKIRQYKDIYSIMDEQERLEWIRMNLSQ